MTENAIPGLEIGDYQAPGWKVLIEDGGGWMAAFMNGDAKDWKLPDRIERHSATDELFLLLEGRAVLAAAGSGEAPGEVKAVEMAPGRLYNVKNRTWHTCAFGPGSRVLIVEAAGTGKANTAKVPLTDEQKAAIQLPGA